MKYLLVITILLSFAVPEKAEAVGLNTVVDCGDWLDTRSELSGSVDQHGTPNRQSLVSEYLLLGFLNGLTLGWNIEFWTITQLKANQIFYWMDKHCRDNPLSDIYDGAIKLFRERTGN